MRNRLANLLSWAAGLCFCLGHWIDPTARKQYIVTGADGTRFDVTDRTIRVFPRDQIELADASLDTSRREP